MKNRKIVDAIAALSLGVSAIGWSGAALAQDRDHGRGPDRGHYDRGHYDRGHDNRGRGPDRFHGPARGPGAGPEHAFYRGGRLPPEYRNRQYVVDDWRGHRLSAPPRGYHWVQTGGDYVLAAIATGVIASIILNH